MDDIDILWNKIPEFILSEESLLKILHKCQTPEEINEAVKIIIELESILSSDQEKGKVEWAFKTFQESVKNETSCFATNYISSLENLRESLLKLF